MGVVLSKAAFMRQKKLKPEQVFPEGARVSFARD
jgi:hypothetical protein